MANNTEPLRVDIERHPDRGWVILWTTADGKKHCIYRSRESEARKKAIAIEEALRGDAPVEGWSEVHEEMKERDGGSLSDWSYVIWAATRVCADNPHSEDSQNLLKAISTAANAARKFLGGANAIEEDDLTGLSDEELMEKAAQGLKGFAENLPSDSKNKVLKLLKK